MATTSFDRKFYVSEENIDKFIDVVTSEPSTKSDDSKFKSRFITGEALEKYRKGTISKNA